MQTTLQQNKLLNKNILMQKWLQNGFSYIDSAMIFRNFTDAKVFYTAVISRQTLMIELIGSLIESFPINL